MWISWKFISGFALKSRRLTWFFSGRVCQLCSGVDEGSTGSCAQLVFAPIDESFADDAPLLPSGFRVIPLDSKTVR